MLFGIQDENEKYEQSAMYSNYTEYRLQYLFLVHNWGRLGCCYRPVIQHKDYATQLQPWFFLLYLALIFHVPF